jgi:hypothetical protein
MSFHVFGDGTCAGIQVLLRRCARPKAYRWTLQLVRRSDIVTPTPDLVRVSFRLPDRVHLEPEQNAHAFFLQHAANIDDRSVATLAADTFSDAGAVIEIFLRDLTFGPGADAGFEESQDIAFRLNKVAEIPISEEVPLIIEAMQIVSTGGNLARTQPTPVLSPPGDSSITPVDGTRADQTMRLTVP